VSRFDNYATVEDLADAMADCRCLGHGYVYADVSVGHRFYGKAIPCRCRTNAAVRERAERLRSTSGLSQIAREQWQFRSFNPAMSVSPKTLQADPAIEEAMRRVARECSNYAKDPKGWLVLVGVYGCGKTHLAVAILNKCLQRDIPAYFATAPRMLDGLRASYSDGSYEEQVRQVQNVGVLLIDDLGSERETDWTAETLAQIIDHRYTNRLPLVVTTNEHPTKRAAKSRIWSRLSEGANETGGRVTVLDIPAGDYRQRIRRVKEARA